MSCPTCKKNIMDTAKAVVTGTKNYLFENPEVEALAGPRLAKCATCPMQRELIRVGSRRVMECTKCKCLTELKARVREEACPLGFW